MNSSTPIITTPTASTASGGAIHPPHSNSETNDEERYETSDILKTLVSMADSKPVQSSASKMAIASQLSSSDTTLRKWAMLDVFILPQKKKKIYYFFLLLFVYVCDAIDFSIFFCANLFFIICYEFYTGLILIFQIFFNELTSFFVCSHFRFCVWCFFFFLVFFFSHY